MAIMEKPKHWVARGNQRTAGRKGKSTKVQRHDPHSRKLAVLIGAPLNGKRFWMRAERFHSSIDAWQAEVRENHH